MNCNLFKLSFLTDAAKNEGRTVSLFFPSSEFLFKHPTTKKPPDYNNLEFCIGFGAFTTKIRVIESELLERQ